MRCSLIVLWWWCWVAAVNVSAFQWLDSISMVPTYSTSQRESDLPHDKTSLRLAIAASYSATAHRLLLLQESTKTIACFAAARGWLRGCPDDQPSPVLASKCTVAGAIVAIQLAGAVWPFDPPASCCAVAEALGLARGNPLLWSELKRTALGPMGYLDGQCPGLAEAFEAGSKTQDAPYSNIQLEKLLQCEPLGLATNAEAQLSSFDLTQGELFRSRHPDLPYDNSRSTNTPGRPASLQDLILRPVRRFSPTQWDYQNGGQSDGDAALLGLIERPVYDYVVSKNMSLGFSEMFHSCIPDMQENPTESRQRLVCVWRRHPELFSMEAAVYASDPFDWHAPRQFQAAVGSQEAAAVSTARLVAPGEDPRLFVFRGRYYFSMQRKVQGEMGLRYSKTSSEAVFRNFLCDVSTGRTVQLRLPPEGWAGAVPPLPEHTKGSTFVPDGKNWIPCVYQDELLFFFTLMPLRVLKCDHFSGQCSWWLPKGANDTNQNGQWGNHAGKDSNNKDASHHPEGKDIGALRGGSAALVIDNLAWRLSDEKKEEDGAGAVEKDWGNSSARDKAKEGVKESNEELNGGGHVAVGFGHATLSSAQHCAFMFAVDLRNLEIKLSFQPPGELTTPFAGFSYMDPASFWQEVEEVEDEEGELKTGTDEAAEVLVEVSGDGLESGAIDNKKKKFVTRTYVACTLRVAPDYLSFDPSHHQTVIFEATSSLLALSTKPQLTSSKIFYGKPHLADDENSASEWI